jgi:hypothetical protein
MELNSGSGPLEWLTSRLKLVFLETWFRGLALCFVVATLHKDHTSLERQSGTTAQPQDWNGTVLA